MKPLSAHDSTGPAEPLSARFTAMPELAPAGAALPTRIMWMPGGVNPIACSQGTKSIQTWVEVTPETARVVQAAFEAHLAASAHRPYFDLNHDHAAASGWPTRFVWSDTPKPGVYAETDWSLAGKSAVAGRSYRTFSPQFYTDCFPFTKTVATQAKPARVTGAPLNMGGLVNDPAFREMEPLFAARARGELNTTTPVDPMTEAELKAMELAALQARIAELEAANAELKANAANTDLTPALQAKEAELAEAQRQLDAQKNEQALRAKRDAEGVVRSAVARGALAASDTAGQERWKGLLEADPKNAELLNKLPGTPALSAQRLVRPAVAIVTEDTNDILRGYLSAKNDHRKRGEIYRRELHGRLDKGERLAFERLPLSATNSLGTLVGDIISQRTLATLVSRRPLLRDVVTDFSDEQARLAQVVQTRAVGLPTVQNFGSSASNAAVTDYPVTLSAHKEVLFSFTATEYNSTGRDLVAEHSLALSTALGNHLVDTVAALITDAFTSETTGAGSTKTFSDLTAATKALNTAGAPDFGRNAWVNSDFAEALANDEVMDSFAGDRGSAYATWRNVKGFENVSEFPALPGNSVNLIGFAFQKNALLLATRLALNPAELIGAGYAGTLQTISDPITGLSVVSNMWIDQATLAINARLILLYGCARGLVGAGHKFVTS